jgi:hypothetical protein
MAVVVFAFLLEAVKICRLDNEGEEEDEDQRSAPL